VFLAHNNLIKSSDDDNKKVAVKVLSIEKLLGCH